MDDERLVSSDSLVKLAHDAVKAHLPAAHHSAYDDAVAVYESRLQAGRSKGSGPMSVQNAAFHEAGYWDPVERLRLMDIDGVDVEVLYCEVSAFRYLADVRGGV